MDDRLIKLFEESRKRHQVEKPKRGRPPKQKVEIKQKVEKPKKQKRIVIKKEPTETELRERRAKKLVWRYKNIDKDRFGDVCDFDSNWIMRNIFNSKCEYCGESDWHLLGCDRIDNSKGHTKDNCICACKRCNMLRGNKFSVEDMKEIGETIKRIEHRNTVYKVAKRKGKQVAKIDRDGNIIKIYPTIIEVIADGYDRCCVGKAASNKYNGSSNVYKNYYWKFLT